MQRFYPDYESIHALSLSLDFHTDKLACAHCFKSDQFVSHGIIYKHRSMAVREKVGKRLFCSNRYGRTGCGRTFQLYVSSELPHFRYHAAHLFVFISALLAQRCVRQAYQKATGQLTSRNAWRWLARLTIKLSEFRSLLSASPDTVVAAFQNKALRLQVLLPTLQQLCHQFKQPCADYQLAFQRPFI